MAGKYKLRCKTRGKWGRRIAQVDISRQGYASVSLDVARRLVATGDWLTVGRRKLPDPKPAEVEAPPASTLPLTAPAEEAAEAPEEEEEAEPEPEPADEPEPELSDELDEEFPEIDEVGDLLSLLGDE